MLIPVLAACGGIEERAAAEDVERGQHAVAAVDDARAVLEWIGILPSYECGEEKRFFAARIVEKLSADHGCVSIKDEPTATTDRATVTLTEECVIGEKHVTGNIGVSIAGGDDRKRVELDLTQLRVGGDPINARVSYGSCGDEDRYGAQVSGTLSDSPKRTFRLDLTVANQDGIFLIGDNTLVLKGGGEVEHPDGVDRVSFDGLSYEIGDVLPKEGGLLVETSAGKRVGVRFEERFWRLGVAEIKVNGDEPVVVPVVH